MLYDNRSGASSVTLQESVAGFSAVEVTCGRWGDSWETKAWVSDFTMVHPSASDSYYVSVPATPDPLIMYFNVSKDGKTISNPTSSNDVKIFRVVGHR